jgi:hypothetical protein
VRIEYGVNCHARATGSVSCKHILYFKVHYILTKHCMS